MRRVSGCLSTMIAVLWQEDVSRCSLHWGWPNWQLRGI